MNRLPLPWSSIAFLALAVLLLSWRRLPPSVLVALLVVAGTVLLYRGWQGWTGRMGEAGRVGYWRGRRIDLGPPRPGGLVSRAGGGTLLSLAAGAALLLAALLMLAQGRV